MEFRKSLVVRNHPHPGPHTECLERGQDQNSSLPHLVGFLTLTAATFLWGTTFVVVKRLVDATHAAPSLPPSVLTFARFAIAAAVFLPFVRFRRDLLIVSAELGGWLWVGYATQAVGQQYTTVGRSAFITSLHVIFVPMLSVATGRPVRPIIWAAALLAFSGAAMLSFDGSPPNVGDAWTLACAMSWAVYIVRLGAISGRFPPMQLTATHLCVVALLSAIWASAEHPFFGPLPWRQLLYLGVITTALTTLMQTVGQARVTAPQAAVIYTMEPVWASLFGFLLLGERFGAKGWEGAGLIVSAAILSQVRPPGKQV